MDRQTVQQLQGAVELLRDAVQVTATALSRAHQDIADTPYKVLRRIPLVSGPAGVVEIVQRDITGLSYRLICTVASMLAAGAEIGLQSTQTR